MSIESAKAFYSKITTEQAFRSQLEQAASKEERQQILQAAGYDFTPAEWKAVTDQIQESTSTDSELSETQLEAVSGGIAAQPLYGVILPDEIIDWIK